MAQVRSLQFFVTLYLLLIITAFFSTNMCVITAAILDHNMLRSMSMSLNMHCCRDFLCYISLSLINDTVEVQKVPASSLLVKYEISRQSSNSDVITVYKISNSSVSHNSLIALRI